MKPKRQLALHLTYRLPVLEDPGPSAFKRYLTPQLVPIEYLVNSGVANHYVNLSLMFQAAQEQA